VYKNGAILAHPVGPTSDHLVTDTDSRSDACPGLHQLSARSASMDELDLPTWQMTAAWSAAAGPVLDRCRQRPN